jgi:hypothetical protein
MTTTTSCCGQPTAPCTKQSAAATGACGSLLPNQGAFVRQGTEPRSRETGLRALAVRAGAWRGSALRTAKVLTVLSSWPGCPMRLTGLAMWVGGDHVISNGLWMVRRTHVRYERLVEQCRLPTCPHVITDALANRSNDVIIETSG